MLLWLVGFGELEGVVGGELEVSGGFCVGKCGRFCVYLGMVWVGSRVVFFGWRG